MKLIIDIPEESYKAIKAGLINSVIQNIWFDSVRNGTPLDDADPVITIETINQYCKEHNYFLCENGTEKIILDDIKIEIEHMACKQY